MAQLRIRNMDEEVVRRLEHAASLRGIPMERPVREILVAKEFPSKAELVAQANAIAAMSPWSPKGLPTSSEVLIRQDRDGCDDPYR
ncbi:MAG: hypothetical protein HQL56_01780 [Magnetococcales bacterium]|nr:hypothetical protein [Magnetococcales bacterium]